MGRMIKTSKKLCIECKYHTGNNTTTDVCCYYFIKTGKRRKCPVGMCNKFVKGKAKEEEWDEALMT